MVRAFAVSTGVGTIRLWVGLLVGTGVTGFGEAFGWAFWLGLSMHVLAGELYLRWHRGAGVVAGPLGVARPRLLRFPPSTHG